MRSTLDLAGEFTIDQVSDVRRFAESLTSDFDPDVRARLAVATHELFENAIKFSADGRASLHIEVELEPLCARIVTANRTSRAHCQSLQKVSTQLATLDPMTFYLSTMRTPVTQRGGLGIGRVVAEAQMAVSIEVADDVVKVQARLELDA